MSVETLEKPKTVEQSEPAKEKKSWFNWEDPTVPMGDSPPIPKWPLALVTTVWIGWVIFLFMMMLSSGSSV